MNIEEDLGYQAHLAAVDRIEACNEAEFDDGPGPDDQCAPYCGCLDCVVRETLDAAWPFLRTMAIEEFKATGQ